MTSRSPIPWLLLLCGCGSTGSASDSGGPDAGVGAGSTGASGGAQAAMGGGGGSSGGAVTSGGAGAGVGAAGPAGGTSGASAAAGATASGGATAGAGATTDPLAGVSCNPTDAVCRSLPPPCAEGKVPAVEGSCWGGCVPIDSCSCASPDDCPEPDRFTCINATGRCSYYLR